MIKKENLIDKENIYIQISGNICSGKTTLTKYLSNYTGWKTYFEPFVDNPYLPKCYVDMKKWAFHSQLTFLVNHYNQHKLIKENENIIMDCSIMECVEIHTKHFFLSELISKEEWYLFNNLYENLSENLIKPNLIIYLHAPVTVLFDRLKKRNRQFEQTLSAEYLNNLNELYGKWISGIDTNILYIDTSKYEANSDSIIKMLNMKLTQI